MYKPLQIKIDYKIETDSRNYDAFKGENLARIADGNRAGSSNSKDDKSDRPSFSSGRMDKTTFVSSVGSNDPRYAVGTMIKGELHLVPIKTFFQMRQPYS
jgi:DNA-directed RNA polymerase-3 subunit RPC5